MAVSDSTATDRQDKVIGPIIFEEDRKNVSRTMKKERKMDVLARYTGCFFQDLQIYLKKEVDLVQDDIRLDLDEYKSCFIIYEILPGIYNFKDISEVLSRNLQSEYGGFNNTVDIE